MLVIIGRAAMSVALIGVLLMKARVREIWAAMSRADATLLVVAFALMVVGYVISTLRWQMLLRALDIHLPFRALLASSCVARLVG
ncbi:MAG: lysylphosphatidylglycerol synthase domain-containing protein, partial [Candidatus Oleimicrobiaceae bacterium]